MRPLILIIDDDLDLREVLETILSDIGYDMKSCTDGKQALTYLQDGGRPDIILVDLMMPGMNGREFLKRQAKIPQVRDIPTFVMSASANLNEEFGAGRYLQKPFNLPLLKRTLDLTLEKSHAARRS